MIDKLCRPSLIIFFTWSLLCCSLCYSSNELAVQEVDHEYTIKEKYKNILIYYPKGLKKPMAKDIIDGHWDYNFKIKLNERNNPKLAICPQIKDAKFGVLQISKKGKQTVEKRICIFRDNSYMDNNHLFELFIDLKMKSQK